MHEKAPGLERRTGLVPERGRKLGAQRGGAPPGASAAALPRRVRARRTSRARPAAALNSPAHDVILTSFDIIIIAGIQTRLSYYLKQT